MDLHCFACFTPLELEGVEARLEGADAGQPFRCPRCGAVHLFTRDPQGVGLVARVLLGIGPEDEIILDARLFVRDDVHFVCAWSPQQTLNAQGVARVLNADPGYVTRLLKQGVFPGAHRAEGGREWRVPLHDVHAYLLRRATSGKRAKRAVKDQPKPQDKEEER